MGWHLSDTQRDHYVSLKRVRLLAITSDEQAGSFFKQGTFCSAFRLFLSLAISDDSCHFSTERVVLWGAWSRVRTWPQTGGKGSVPPLTSYVTLGSHPPLFVSVSSCPPHPPRHHQVVSVNKLRWYWCSVIIITSPSAEGNTQGTNVCFAQGLGHGGDGLSPVLSELMARVAIRKVRGQWNQAGWHAARLESLWEKASLWRNQAAQRPWGDRCGDMVAAAENEGDSRGGVRS